MKKFLKENSKNNLVDYFNMTNSKDDSFFIGLPSPSNLADI